MSILYKTFLENVEEVLGDKSAYWLAKEANVSTGTISRILGKKMVPSLETIENIANALSVHPWDMLTPKSAKKSSIPSDLLKKLENQDEAVYQTIRAMLGPLAAAASSKQKK